MASGSAGVAQEKSGRITKKAAGSWEIGGQLALTENRPGVMSVTVGLAHVLSEIMFIHPTWWLIPLS